MLVTQLFIKFATFRNVRFPKPMFHIFLPLIPILNKIKPVYTNCHPIYLRYILVLGPWVA